ncbi:peptide-N-glycosidase F-related protein [Psychroserpens ponticola]|uniref:Peptide-N-glycosidase F-related protein n=1 Tax=Psychroserpens ponticola TaxID=2932268 RepID=A0ABY7S0V9_9FLAO|nr:peptide-N-glycosidase F-related protein [Psychroserpens ponticola]WCO02932.1 peptide-N-glycosidase F-related protein [Psychroserpens ponticola]
MKTSNFKKSLGVLIFLMGLLFIVNCSSDDSSNDSNQQSKIIVTGAINSFGEVDVASYSASQNVIIKGASLSSDVSVTVTSNFEISLDDVNFTNQLTISKSEANGLENTLYLRFSPVMNSIGPIAGTVSIESDSATTRTLNLNGTGLSITPLVTVNTMSFIFDDTQVLSNSTPLTLYVDGDNLNSVIDIATTEGFEVSLDGTAFSDVLQIPSESANGQATVYVRFAPLVLGSATGILSVVNSETDNIEVSLTGEGVPITHNYTTFSDEPLAFGTGFSQSAEQAFTLHQDMSNIEQIKMFLQIDCPATGCDDWDRFANVLVRDSNSGDWYEIGRYITPYWVGTELLPRGLEFDVTDFKSLLTGNVELRIYIENWTSKADLISIDFDYIEGTPDYEYYAIAEVMQYNENSLEGVPYGVTHDFDLTRSVSVPSNAESTHLRTVISGWGHATPNDSDGRPCAEWCYRSHDVKINGAIMFQHNMEPIGCASNPINNQSPGNWSPDRAGWCPGMAVPARINQFGLTMAGSSFSFEYDYEDWVSDLAGGDAYYATSTFVVVKSNTPIAKPVVMN